MVLHDGVKWWYVMCDSVLWSVVMCGGVLTYYAMAVVVYGQCVCMGSLCRFIT